MIRGLPWLLLSLSVLPAHAVGTARIEKDIA